jgi:hypothetical protein
VQQQYLHESWGGFAGKQKSGVSGGDELDEQAKKLEVSISLRMQVLGQIRLEGKEEWTPDQQSLWMPSLPRQPSPWKRAW